MKYNIQPCAAKKKCDGCEKVTLVTLFTIPSPSQDRRNVTIALCDSCIAADNRTYQKLHRYKISLEDYERMFQNQNGTCAVCKMPETRYLSRSDRVVPLAVDHNHVTGQVRALLCAKCNAALGLLGEDPDRMEALARYIRKHKE